MRGEPELVLEYWRCCSQHNWYSETYNISYLGTKISCEAARKGTIKDSWICLIWSDPHPHDCDQYSGTFFGYLQKMYFFLPDVQNILYCTWTKCGIFLTIAIVLLCVFVCVLENRGKLFMFQLYPPAAGCCILYDNLLYSTIFSLSHCPTLPQFTIFISSFWILFFDATSNIKASVTHWKKLESLLFIMHEYLYKVTISWWSFLNNIHH